MCEWFLDDGTCLNGKEAEEFLAVKLDYLKRLSNKIEKVIEDCKLLNYIEENESLALSVMETGERLSNIQIMLELLVEEMNYHL